MDVIAKDRKAGEERWRERVREAMQTLMKYKNAKAALEERVIGDERYMRLRNWDQKREKADGTGVNTRSAWLLNVILNKHADAMDNYPEPSVLPREKADETAARQLTEVLPCVLEQNDYEAAYDAAWWDKLEKGTGIKCVTWDNQKNGGLGDVAVSAVDILNLYWEPGITDIQQSEHVFCVTLMDTRRLREAYPGKLENAAGGATFTPGRYENSEGEMDISDKSCVIDWYYKREGRLHYVKFVDETVLYASEDDPACARRGFYDHGLYPFVFDPLIRMSESPAGFGYVDVCRDTQDYIDRLDSAVMRSALHNTEPRYAVRLDAGINEEELLDPKARIVHVVGEPKEAVQPLDKDELSAVYVQVLNNKVEELKDTSGNSAFQQGSTAAGVTAYSAIAALQEAGSKLSRDMIKASYRSFRAECYLILELIRQFYTEERYFRVTGATGQDEYRSFSNREITTQTVWGAPGMRASERLPVFDIKVRAHKQTAYSRMAQNELAKELYGAGLFAPGNADQALVVLEMMQFEGVEQVRQRVRQNGMLQAQLQQAMQVIARLTGQAAPEPPTGGGGSVSGEEMRVNSLGAEKQSGSRINAPREAAAAGATPQ